MSNLLYQELQKSLNRSLPNNTTSINEAMMVVKNSKNPQQMIMQLAQNNPQLSQILKELNSSGLSPKDLFMQRVNQLGISPDSILKMLR